MKKNGLEFNTSRMPEKWRRHSKVYRAKISIYLDTPDFGTPLMVDASEMMGFLPVGIDAPSFLEKASRPSGVTRDTESVLTRGPAGYERH
jgi:hypothetical protein